MFTKKEIGYFIIATFVFTYLAYACRLEAMTLL